MDQDNFCSTCGKPLDLILKKYDKKTGAPIYKTKCSSGICGHDGIDHDWKRGKWSFFVGRSTIICKNCGVEELVPIIYEC